MALSQERWAYIKQLAPANPRWVHISVSYRDEEVADPDTGLVHTRRVRVQHGSYRKSKAK
jgi:hypothetical protein